MKTVETKTSTVEYCFPNSDKLTGVQKSYTTKNSTGELYEYNVGMSNGDKGKSSSKTPGTHPYFIKGEEVSYEITKETMTSQDGSEWIKSNIKYIKPKETKTPSGQTVPTKAFYDDPAEVKAACMSFNTTNAILAFPELMAINPKATPKDLTVITALAKKFYSWCIIEKERNKVMRKCYAIQQAIAVMKDHPIIGIAEGREGIKSSDDILTAAGELYDGLNV